jgi:hypothetical protein
MNGPIHGTVQHKGKLTGLAILKLYCECLGTTWTGNSDRDPVVYFRTADMVDTSRWQRLPGPYQRNLPRTKPKLTLSPNRVTQLTRALIGHQV